MARSTELNTALGILGGLVVLNLAGRFIFEELSKVSRFFWGDLKRDELGLEGLQTHALTLGLEFLYILSPLLLGALVVGLLSNALQVGIFFAPQAMSLKFENLSPVKGFGRMFSRRSAIEFLKGVLKIALIVLVGMVHHHRAH